jgi:pyruvate/2-oxoglutarate dehydrogenase complex dihydrolipoamide acyltransferase (E2) component
MGTQIILPKLGFAMTEGSIAEWLVPDGGSVTQGQPLFSLENDKAVQEVEAAASGTLKILTPPGQSCPVGTIIGEIL